MILYIAEKPSLARAIADVLPKPHKKQEGYIELGNGDCVSWCLGHLLELADPADYHPDFKPWRFEHLPIIPDEWKLKPRSKTRSQLAVLRRLIRQSKQLVHAGDPDREGQLLVDEVINYLGASETKKKTARRLLISDLNPKAVSAALQNLKLNSEFIPLSVSALARSRADWIYGINMTRAYSIQGRKAGYQGVLSVGRVQTPLLGLVVRRDAEIEHFVSKPFYEVQAVIETQAGERFNARWKPSESCQPYQDEDGRVLHRKLAETVINRITGQPAEWGSLTQKRKRENAPLPFSLSSLQIEAAKRFGLSAKAVLDSCQTLYERHKLLTYPRSDCRYLPEDHFTQAADVIDSVMHNQSSLAEHLPQIDAKRRSAAWNNKKVSAHHAIIPTTRQANLASLSDTERKLYILVSRYYLAQFMPPYEYYDTRVDLRIAGGQFIASAHQTQHLGWKSLLSETAEKHSRLPPLSEGQPLTCIEGVLEEKNTQPPKYFTDATLLAAMTGIGRYVTDQAIRKVLKETDGLGTEATRAGIIELLFNRGFLQREGKAISSTEVGRALINCLPNSATTPDMTALWESELGRVCQQEASYSSFMQPLAVRLRELILQSSQVVIPDTLKALSPKPKPKRRTSRTSTRKPVSGAKRASAKTKKPSKPRKTTSGKG
ncbi:DNA topoisomerase III [Amphritea sp. 1_MG-2023]|uniref:DNA topoisomerase III n=1 Tax=Amphritea sp. 1_MG-2023 TaxID=3062670 RepID=UPI0026E3B396|nr:DNA topoisomerase III [Amphritea sp. 1_MG-2023]MDO6562301.1 DNA topoisomerase III [Amphritea sp. 1_MG-2023]